MQNYRTKLGSLGHPEIRVNSLKHEQEGQVNLQLLSRSLERLNYIPLHTNGETAGSLEKEGIVTLPELKKRENEVVIKAKMEKTPKMP